MANEIIISINDTLTNPSTSGTTAQLKDTFAPGAVKINQTTQLMWGEAITCTTADTAVSFTGVTTNGWCHLQNLDATNYVDVGPTSGGALVPLVRMKAGEVAAFRLTPTAALRVQANTASCKVLFKVWND